jgi:hypothetical protein
MYMRCLRDKKPVMKSPVFLLAAVLRTASLLRLFEVVAANAHKRYVPIWKLSMQVVVVVEVRPRSGIRLLLISILLFSSSCFADAVYRGIADDHTTAGKHGLYEIREEARKFVARENGENLSTWEVLDPNLKIVVPRCAIPLKTKWAPKDRGLSSKSVWVICERTVDEQYKKWDVFVPVALPRQADAK